MERTNGKTPKPYFAVNINITSVYNIRPYLQKQHDLCVVVIPAGSQGHSFQMLQEAFTLSLLRRGCKYCYNKSIPTPNSPRPNQIVNSIVVYFCRMMVMLLRGVFVVRWCWEHSSISIFCSIAGVTRCSNVC